MMMSWGHVVALSAHDGVPAQWFLILVAAPTVISIYATQVGIRVRKTLID